MAVASILASNFGVIFIAWTTYAVIVKQQRKTDMRALIGVQVVGWAFGCSLASYYYSKDYLGIYLGLYCCTKTKDELDIVIPVFLTFFIATGTMAFFYFKTFAHIRKVQMSAQSLKSNTSVATTPFLPPHVQLTVVPATPVNKSSQTRASLTPLRPDLNAGSNPRMSPQSIAAALGATSPLDAVDVNGVAVSSEGVPQRGFERWASAPASSPDDSTSPRLPTQLHVSSPVASPRLVPATPLSPAHALESSPTLLQIAPAEVTSPSHSANGDSGEGVGAFVLADTNPAAVVPTQSKAVVLQQKKSRDVALSMLLRGLGLIAAYYFCWTFV
jgi:hypothetical protein